MWTKDCTLNQLLEVIEVHSKRQDDNASEQMVEEAKAELKGRDVVMCDLVGRDANKYRNYWTGGKFYTVVRRTKASFWVHDDLGHERRFSAVTGGSTEDSEGFKTYLI